MGAIIPSAVGVESGVAAGNEQFEALNATPVVLKAIPLPGQNTLTVMVLVGATVNGEQSYGGLVIGRFRNPGFDTATRVGTADGDAIVAYSGTWATLPVNSRPKVQFAVSAGNCLVQFVGIAATQIKGSFTIVQAQTEQ
jgi:hypothetical protein